MLHKNRLTLLLAVAAGMSITIHAQEEYVTLQEQQETVKSFAQSPTPKEAAKAWEMVSDDFNKMKTNVPAELKELATTVKSTLTDDCKKLNIKLKDAYAAAKDLVTETFDNKVANQSEQKDGNSNQLATTVATQDAAAVKASLFSSAISFLTLQGLFKNLENKTFIGSISQATALRGAVCLTIATTIAGAGYYGYNKYQEYKDKNKDANNNSN